MSNVVTANSSSNNATRNDTKQQQQQQVSDSLSHHHHHHHHHQQQHHNQQQHHAQQFNSKSSPPQHLSERTSQVVNRSDHQHHRTTTTTTTTGNNNPLLSKRALIESNGAYGYGDNNINRHSGDPSCMRLNNYNSVIVEAATGFGSNHLSANCNSKGVKRPNDTDEELQGRVPVVISSSQPSACVKVEPPPANSAAPPVTAVSASATTSAGSQHKLTDLSNQPQQDEGEAGSQEGDSADEEPKFDYDSVLFKILNEKKLALSSSPDVIKFLSAFREQQHQQQQH